MFYFVSFGFLSLMSLYRKLPFIMIPLNFLIFFYFFSKVGFFEGIGSIFIFAFINFLIFSFSLLFCRFKKVNSFFDWLHGIRK